MKKFKSITVSLMLLLGLATYSNAASMDNKMDKMSDNKVSNISSAHQQFFITDHTQY